MYGPSYDHLHRFSDARRARKFSVPGDHAARIRARHRNIIKICEYYASADVCRSAAGSTFGSDDAKHCSGLFCFLRRSFSHSYSFDSAALSPRDDVPRPPSSSHVVWFRSPSRDPYAIMTARGTRELSTTLFRYNTVYGQRSTPKTGFFCKFRCEYVR